MLLSRKYRSTTTLRILYKMICDRHIRIWCGTNLSLNIYIVNFTVFISIYIYIYRVQKQNLK